MKASQVDYRKLLIKYVYHVGAAEGDAFARNVDLAPCRMPSDEEFTEEERQALQSIFDEMNEQEKPRG